MFFVQYIFDIDEAKNLKYMLRNIQDLNSYINGFEKKNQHLKDHMIENILNYDILGIIKASNLTFSWLLLQSCKFSSRTIKKIYEI